jgi:hypothetical protein
MSQKIAGLKLPILCKAPILSLRNYFQSLDKSGEREGSEASVGGVACNYNASLSDIAGFWGEEERHGRT